MEGLEGVHVLELGELVSSPYAAKLMADLGADVVKIEPPGGDIARTRGPFPNGIADAEKSGLFLYLNTNKRSVVLDLKRERETLLRAFEWADVLVHNFMPATMEELGLVYSDLSQRNPR